MQPKLSGLILGLAWSLVVAGVADAERNWPGWRGPDRTGHTSETGFPKQWDDRSVQWMTDLPGRGNSSPTIWGERIFLTSALQQGRSRLVICLDRRAGEVLWQRTAWTGNPEPTHEMNGWASSTCATDGRHVYAFFGRGGGLHCYTVEGEHVWSRDLGVFEGPWGTAASPLLVDDMVIQNCDSDQNAYLVALDKRTGNQVWRTSRPDHRGWSSPILIRAGQRAEVVLNGHEGLHAYEPSSGKLLWTCACPAGRGSPTVAWADAHLFAVNGLSGGGAYCVRPGGSGDVTETDRIWFQRRRGRDLSSPIVLGKVMLVAALRSGILTAYDRRSGDELWRKRIGEKVSASPIAADDVAFFIDESGATAVVDPSAEEKVIAINRIEAPLDETFRSSITPLGGQLFIRSDQKIYCVGMRTASAS